MNLKESIANYKLGNITVSQLPKVALEALANGHESASLVILAGMDEKDNSFEILEYYQSALNELGLIERSNFESALILANYYTQRILSNTIDPIKGVAMLKNDCWESCNELPADTEYVFDGVKFQRIIGPWYEYHDVSEQSEWIKKSGKSIGQIKDEIKEEIMESLSDWNTKYLAPGLEVILK